MGIEELLKERSVTERTRELIEERAEYVRTLARAVKFEEDRREELKEERHYRPERNIYWTHRRLKEILRG